MKGVNEQNSTEKLKPAVLSCFIIARKKSLLVNIATKVFFLFF